MSTKDEQFTGYRTNHPDDLAHFASVRNFQDFLVDKANPVVMVTLTIDGKGFLDNATFETHLTQHTNAHDEFTIIVNDTAIDDFKGQVMKNSQELLGQNITIHFHQYGSVIYTFRGIIAHICNKKNQGGGYGKLHISGYAPSIVLDGGKTCQSYENKTLPEIIKEATEEYPQESQIHIEGLINNEEKIPYTVQYNESDYQFIQRLAKRYGEFFYYNGTQFIFGSRAQKTITLYEGGGLREVEFELLLKPQKFNYLSYNSQMTRTEVKGSEQTETQYKENPFQFTAIKASEKVFAKTTDQTYGALPDEFRGDYLKDAVQREKESREQLMQVRGRSRNPHVHIGCFVKLIDINGLPMETYRVIDVTHYQGEGIYYNEFVAIPDVFVAYYYDEQALPKAEQQPARVIDNNDPEGWGRVRVQFIWQEKHQTKTPWIRVVQPHTGADKGFYFIPEIGEEVWVDFEDQNAERPFVVGSNYNGKEFSKYHTAGNDKKVIHTRSGTKIILNDGEGSVFIEDPSGNTYLMDGQGNINVSAPKNISFSAGENVNIKAGTNCIMEIGNDLFTTVQNNHKLEVLNDYDFSSNNYSQEIKGDKGVEISGKLLESTAETFHQAREGNVTIHSAQVAKLLGSSDTKVNISEVAKLTDILKKLSKTTIHTGGGQSVKTLFGKLEEKRDNTEYTYYTIDGEFLGSKNESRIYIVKKKDYESKEFNKLNNYNNLLKEKIGDTEYVFSHKEFKEIVGTIYAEATKGEKGSWEESAAIYNVVLNRAIDDENTSIYLEIQEGGINGWTKRNNINSKLANSKDVRNAFKGVIKGIMDSKDYSNGAYYWDGTDYKTTSRYKRGTIFTKEEHNIWKLAKNAKPGKNEYGKWDAVYETTQAIGLTTFSKLTEKFINTRYRKGVKVKWDGTKK
ncbi:type VI secretion system Vgr family protein [Capnocytophaga sputigena]|jgi:phage-related baseplate assembly protein|uniref:type VI secretion system Vgr family protein n=1 Tax=Capnocytophaga sputigena TaxID=1019 RepID=UPI001F3B57CA|nr:phage baseplate assembly protein V [Capnocytophaga sputigena]